MVPHVVASAPKVIVSEWLDGTPLSRDHLQRHAGAARPRRPCCSPFLILRAAAGRAAARRPAPGQLPAAATTAGSASSTSARSTGCPTGHPEPIGRLLRLGAGRQGRGGARRAARRGLRQADVEVDAEAVLDYLRADARAGGERADFHFTRAWMQEQAARIADPRSEASRLGTPAEPAAGLSADPPGDARARSACSASSTPRATSAACSRMAARLRRLSRPASPAGSHGHRGGVDVHRAPVTVPGHRGRVAPGLARSAGAPRGGPQPRTCVSGPRDPRRRRPAATQAGPDAPGASGPASTRGRSCRLVARGQQTAALARAARAPRAPRGEPRDGRGLEPAGARMSAESHALICDPCLA